MKTSALITCLLCLGLSSCGLLRRHQPIDPQPEEEPSLYVGQIASVHLNQGFVLIRRSPHVTVPSGTILISTSPGGQAANLRVTGESLGLMIAADVQSGDPQVGDTVNRSALDQLDSDPSALGESL